MESKQGDVAQQQIASFRAFVATLNPVLAANPVTINYEGDRVKIVGFHNDGYFLRDGKDPNGGAALHVPCNETTLPFIWSELGLPETRAMAAGAQG